jgi:hypothetical protein
VPPHVTPLTLAFVRRAAHNHIADAAKRVGHEVELQASILGRGGDIHRAIKMFGRTGTTKETQQVPTGYVDDGKTQTRKTSIISLFQEDMVGTAEGALEEIFFLPSTGLRRAFGFMSTHRILLVLLGFSIIFNLFLSGRSTMNYWHMREAENFLQRAGMEKQNSMRMVSLKDIDNLVSNGTIGPNASGLWYSPRSPS